MERAKSTSAKGDDIASGIFEHEAGRYASSVAIFRSSLAVRPGSRQARLWLSRSLTKVGETVEAIRLLRELTDEDADDATAWLYLGEASMMAGQFAIASEAYSSGVACALTDARTVDASLTMVTVDNVGTICAHYSGPAAPSLSVIGRCLLGIGRSLCRRGKWEEALEVLDASQSLLPESCDVLYALGHAHSQLERWSEAVVDYRGATQLRPNVAKYWSLLGGALLMRGDSENLYAAAASAEEAARQAIALDPRNRMARRVLREAKRAKFWRNLLRLTGS